MDELEALDTIFCPGCKNAIGVEYRHHCPRKCGWVICVNTKKNAIGDEVACATVICTRTGRHRS